MVKSETSIERHLQLREFVFNSEGYPCGEVSQKSKTLYTGDDFFHREQSFHVLPGMKLPVMQTFRGHHSFEGTRDGNHWTFNGPDIIGQGSEFGNHHLFFKGVWPKFGHHFEAITLKGYHGRQLTGRMFYNGLQLVAVTSSIAVDQTQDKPNLDLEKRPWERSLNWEGIETQVSADGNPSKEYPMTRCFEGETGYIENSGGDEHLVAIIPRIGRDVIKNNYDTGTGKRYGNFYSFNAFGPKGKMIRGFEIFDSDNVGSILTMKLIYCHGALKHTLVSRLQPIDL